MTATDRIGREAAREFAALRPQKPQIAVVRQPHALNDEIRWKRPDGSVARHPQRAMESGYWCAAKQLHWVAPVPCAAVGLPASISVAVAQGERGGELRHAVKHAVMERWPEQQDFSATR